MPHFSGHYSFSLVGLRMVSEWCPTRTARCVGLFIAARREALASSGLDQYGELLYGVLNEASEDMTSLITHWWSADCVRSVCGISHFKYFYVCI